MKWLYAFLAVLILFLLQDGVLIHLVGRFFYPNLALVFVFIVALFGSRKETLYVALPVGLILDFVSGYPDGVFVIAVLLSAIVLNLVVGQFLSREISGLILHASVATGFIMVYLLIWGIMRGDYQITPAKFFLDIAFNSLFTYPVYLYYNLARELINRKN